MFSRLASKNKEHFHAEPAWVEDAAGRIFCPDCRTIYRSRHPEPIDVTLMEWPEAPAVCGRPARAGVPIFGSDFVAQIGECLPDAAIGRCLTADGQVFQEYVTMYLPRCVLMRGDTKTKYKVCKGCGAIWTDLVMVFPGRPAYLLRHQLTDALIYQGGYGSLFIARELANRLDWSPFPDVRLEPVEVRDTPLDGRRLPGDPDWSSLRT
jgi:hypothetical protein